MSEESLFREVDEEVRRDQLQRLWQRYGTYLVAACIGVVLAVAGMKAWQYWHQTQSEANGAAYYSALSLDTQKKTDESLAAFQKLGDKSNSGTAILAKLQAASLLVKQGKNDEAIKALDVVVATAKIDPRLRDLAKIQAAYLAADKASVEDMKNRVSALNEPTGPWQNSAREVLAIAYYNAADYSNADRLVNEILGDPLAPSGIRERAKIMNDTLLPLLPSSSKGGQ